MSKKLDGLKVAIEIANSMGGMCLSTEYKNNHTKMSWKCKRGHNWSANLSNIKNNKWCPYCAGVKILNGLEVANKIANERGGKCLSTEYISVAHKMLWECKEKHRWFATLSNIKNYNNKWCPICAIEIIRKKNTLKNGLEIAQRMATKNNGHCLSSEYKNSETKIKWKCAKGHVWLASLCVVKNNKCWCPECAILNRAEKRKLQNGLIVAQTVAQKNKGLCLSSKYIGIKNKMIWKCKAGHTWASTLDNIKNNGCWCPRCGNIQKARNQANSYILYHWKTGEELVCVASYEKAVVEYFNKNKINFRWQSKTFIMPNKKTYRPDLYLFSTKKWVEIKGYFRKDAEKKWKWFHEVHPNSELWNRKILKEMGLEIQ